MKYSIASLVVVFVAMAFVSFPTTAKANTLQDLLGQLLQQLQTLSVNLENNTQGAALGTPILDRLRDRQISTEPSASTPSAPAVTTSAPTQNTTAAKPPVCTSFTATPASVRAGATVTLNWKTANATKATLDRNIGSVAVNGTRTVKPTNTTTYNLTITNAAGDSAKCSVTAKVITDALPKCDSFTATPATIKKGETSVLKWNTRNVTSVTLKWPSGNVTSHGPNGSVNAGPAQTYTFVLTAKGPGGSVNCSVKVTVTQSAPAPKCDSFTTNRPTIQKGQSAGLNWETTNATKVTINQGIGNVAVDSGVWVSPVVTTTYTLTATNADGKSVTCTTKVAVTEASGTDPEPEPGNTSGSAAPTKPGTYERQITVDGLKRTYLVHIPKKYDAKKAVPIVLFYHGGGGSAAQAAEDYNWKAKADAEGFIVVFMQGTSRRGTDLLSTWNAGECCDYARDNNTNDVKYTRDVIAALRTDYLVDNKKIFATGFSNGAMMSHRLACELSGTFAAIGAVSGTDNTKKCAPGNKVSIFHIHALDDDAALYYGGYGPTFADDPDKVTDFTSVPETIKLWRQRNGITTSQVRVLDKSGAYCDVSTAKDGVTRVKLCTVEKGGHAWPGGSGESAVSNGNPKNVINATDLIWDFFMMKKDTPVKISPNKSIDLSFCQNTLKTKSGTLCAIQPSKIDSRTLNLGSNSNPGSNKNYGYGHHVFAVPTNWSTAKGVWVHFGGSGGKPYDAASKEYPTSEWLDELMAAGYAVLQIAYENTYPVNELCGKGTPGYNRNNCAGELRGESQTGRNLSPYRSVNTYNSIDYRLSSLIDYIENKQKISLPGGIDKKVDWSKLSLSGHSQGGNQAYYIARDRKVKSVCIMSSGYDGPDSVKPGNGVVADWLTTGTSQTATKVISAIVATNDDGYKTIKQSLERVIGLPKSQIVYVDKDPYKNTAGKTIDGHAATIKDPRLTSDRTKACF